MWQDAREEKGMTRIAPLRFEEASEAVRQLMALERPSAIALVFGHAQTNWPRLADLMLSILSEQQLDPRLRELAILRVARLRGAVYEWEQHLGIGCAAGVRSEQIAAIEAGRIDAACFSARERLALDAATQLVERGTVETALFERLARELSPREVVELLLATAVYEAAAKLMNAVELDSEGPIDPGFAAAVNRGQVTRAKAPRVSQTGGRRRE
jgi:alkylhydroperoxidase family enzyme